MRDVERDAGGQPRQQRRLGVRIEGEPEPDVHQHPEREAEQEHERREREPAAEQRPGEAGEEAAAAPGQHLPRRVRALAEEEVRRDRGERADGEAAARAERDARGGDDHRHRLHARDRREEHATRCGEAAERRDERQVARRDGAALEPGEAGDEHGDRGEQGRDPAAAGVERGPGGERERGTGGESGDPRRQRAAPESLCLKQHEVRFAGARAARGRAWRRERPCRAAAYSCSQSRKLGLALRVEPARRLVEHEHVGLGDRDGREREPLALSAREIARVATCRPAETDAVERGPSPAVHPGSRPARPPRAQSP